MFIGACLERLENRRLFTIPGSVLGAYHSYADLAHDLRVYNTTYPNITQLIRIGISVQGRNLWALKITDNPEQQEDEPELKYVGSMHGDEPVGMENTLQFATMLLEGYGTDSRLTKLVDTTEIWIIPNMNPDGLELDQRGNANDVDLNRNFPEGAITRIGNIYSGPPMDTSGVEPEVEAMMKWSAGQSVNLSANFHGGSLLVNYPYDSNNNGEPDYAASPDDNLFKSIALVYAEENATMTRDSIFPQGITNGDFWYEVAGGMQDWSYRYLGENAVTIELSYVKKPDPTELQSLWNENREAMLKYAESIHWGLRGVVTRSTDDQPLLAKVTVVGNTHGVYTDPDVGDYHRMLLPGVYSINVASPGYHTRKFNSIVISSTTSDADLTKRLDVRLRPIDEQAPQIIKSDLGYDQTSPAVQFAFDEAISQSVNARNLRLVNTDKQKLVSATPTVAYADASTKLQFFYTPGRLPDGNYRAVLSNENVKDVWGNPIAADTAVKFFVLGADANRDRRVDDLDLQALAGHFGSNAPFSSGDFDYSGKVDSCDFAIFLGQRGKRVPLITTTSRTPSVLPDLFSRRNPFFSSDSHLREWKMDGL